jgi:type II secretory pathway pseudopilin PulG
MRSNPKRRALTLMELIVVLVILIALAGLLVPLVSSTSSNAQDTTTRATMTALRDAVMSYYQDMKGIQVWTDGTTAPPGTTGVPLTLKDLQVRPNDSTGTPVPLFDPFTRRGWRGPYVLQSTGSFLTTLDGSFYPTTPVVNPYGNPGDLAFVDGWGNPIVLQWPQTGDTVATQALNVRLVSAGAPSKLVHGTMVSVLDTVPGTLIPTQPTPSQPNLRNERAPNQSGGRNQSGQDFLLFLFTQDQYP